jgi:two-component system phosphate regulon sensor histidine kinase PhoR
MTKSILRYFITVILVTLTINTLLSTIVINHQNLTTTEENMLYALKLIDSSLDYSSNVSSQIQKLNTLAYRDDTRITITDSSGNVIGDTYENNLENHKDRKEFKEALEKGTGYALRLSETTRVSTLYVAYYNNGHILRISVPYNAAKEYFHSMMTSMLVSVIFSFIIALILSRKLAYTISKPILEIGEGIDSMSEDYRFHLKEYKYDEFNTIVETIHNLSHRLRKSMREVDYEKEKINEILKQMSEGFILLDNDNQVISINKKAIEILGDISLHQNIIECIQDEQLINALNNQATEQQLQIKADKHYYTCFISRTELGTTLFFADITASKKSEKMRSEFFSNVSHELKTPITSIKGYSELLAMGYINDEKTKQQMIHKISNEVNNMSRLINDILMLSSLESKTVETEMLPLKMKSIVLEVLESYEIDIDKHDLHVHIHFDEIDYIGNHQQMYTLLNNIIGNAIKYNKDGGSVDIDMVRAQDDIKIIVKDTGIGIPKADQTRIFERFYRVDKGRSRQLGGTGLGLAIVKHIVSLYNGTIHLTSELDIGTTIVIVLPMQRMN